VNPVNLASVIVHWITFNDLPAADLAGRPLSAYGNLIHNQCERRPHWEFGEFATEWGDQGAQEGWCLYKLGCKGPETMGNCPTVKYGEKISWNVRAGHGCIGCMTPSFWNEMGPAYKRLPPPLFFLPNVTTDMLGGGLLAGIGGVAGVHAVGMGVRFKRRRMIAARERAKAGVVAQGVVSSVTETEAEPVSDAGASRGAGVEPSAALDQAERAATTEAAPDVATPSGPEER
jgi:hydrogenase small subunit